MKTPLLYVVGEDDPICPLGWARAFAQRYRAKYNSDPTRIATLAYDATTLAIALARSQGPAQSITH